MSIEYILFLIVLTAVSIDLLGLFITKFTRFRTWPPIKGTLTWYVELALTWIWTPGFFLVSLISINTFISTKPSYIEIQFIRTMIGSYILFFGLAIFIAGVIKLGSGYVKEEGCIVTTGIYSYTRNPQYVGSLLMGIGMVITTNSLYAFIIAIPAALWFITAPFVEEKLMLSNDWIGRYKHYCKKVPRFF